MVCCEISNTFPCNIGREHQLLSKLNTAYREIRYSLNYSIQHTALPSLTKKVQHFISICEQHQI